MTLALAGALLAPNLAVAQSSVTVGTGNTNFCLPFGCGRGATEQVQESFAASAFGGPLNIGALTFYNTVSSNAATSTFVPGTFNVYLGYATRAPLTTDLAGNISSEQLFASFTTTNSLVGPSFTFSGTPFLYDPSQGPLLLDVVGTSIGSATNETYFNADCGPTAALYACGYTNGILGTSTAVSSAYRIADYSGVSAYRMGDVVTFSDVTTTPEPGSVALLGTGLVALMPILRRRRV